MVGLHENIFLILRVADRKDRCLAIKYTHRCVRGIEGVKAGLEQLHLRASLIDKDVILFVDIVDFHIGFAALKSDLSVREIG